MQSLSSVPSTMSGGLQPLVTPGSEDLLSSSGFCGHLHLCAQTLTQIIKKLIKINYMLGIVGGIPLILALGKRIGKSL